MNETKHKNDIRGCLPRLVRLVIRGRWLDGWRNFRLSRRTASLKKRLVSGKTQLKDCDYNQSNSKPMNSSSGASVTAVNSDKNSSKENLGLMDGGVLGIDWERDDFIEQILGRLLHDMRVNSEANSIYS